MMKLGVISDIHGNYLAFEAVLADLRVTRPDRLICLGDAIQGGPQPREVARALRRLGCPVVMGNADDWLLTGMASDAEAVSAERQAKMDAVRAWSLAQLDEDDKAFIAGFTPTVTDPLDGARGLLGFHGSPTSFDHVLLPTTPEDEFQARLGAFGPNIMCGGHTHLQQVRRLGDAFFFNPGSVGLAYSHTQPDDQFRADPWAEYALLSVDDGRVGLEFRRVPFDAAAMRQVYVDSGRPFGEEAAGQYGSA
jgi:predicted phosphodiesterase